MDTVELVESLRYEIPIISDLREETRIHAEISERIAELDEISWHRLQRWLVSLAYLAQNGRRCLLWYCYLQSGDQISFARTLDEIGRKHSWSKQALQQETKRDLDAVRHRFPELAAEIESHIKRRLVAEPDHKPSPAVPPIT